jgi:beta-N-acetylhexosaminidase
VSEIHQLLMIGLQGTELEPWEERLLSDYNPGAVILFNRNINSAEQTYSLCRRVNELCEIPPIIAADQEGGRVDRLRALLSTTLSPSDFRDSADPQAIRAFGVLTARLLLALGINMNLAPVVDLEIVTADNSLRGRLWGGDPLAVSEKAGAFLDGLQKEGVIGCLKHFPGLGRAEVDSHRELPVVRAGLEKMRRVDLIPFAALAQRAPAVMVAHCLYSGLDGARLPASLSPDTYRILREEIGFNGVALTDDLEMEALSGFSCKERLAAALNAGADMLPLCTHRASIEQAFSLIEELADDGSLPSARIEESITRVLQLKDGLPPPTDVDPAEAVGALDRQLALLRKEVVGEREA